MNLLSRILEHFGVNSPSELSPEEQKTYYEYKARLAKADVSVTDILEFCKDQVKVIEGRCNGVEPLTNIQQACLHIYISIIGAIEGREDEREALERHLESIIQPK